MEQQSVGRQWSNITAAARRGPERSHIVNRTTCDPLQFSDDLRSDARQPVPPENIHLVPTDGTPDDAARRYERTLQEAYGAAALDPQRALFDITPCGAGSDAQGGSARE